MNSQSVGLRVSALLFGLVSLIQLLRFVKGAEVIVAGYNVPLAASAVAFVLLAALSIWLWRLSSRGMN